ncbi:PD-(D/E)XK nuclease-like domain-containing protein [Gluconobacter thailandicus]|uniref:Putative exodeoxyribonuclease 8 PDDEXK-like domain-containing protein n=1 Tax=Gluconobacter thailandicus TaxID=257438 RepID=A0AAP9JIJ0_GLUTH|nr:PD-(D/E)XK nuclease-like domain-containing protein [Gluconobacter thailandicus]QEH97323.1 hypothetical protein FXF46_14475 [Gluconobacter thailandicus]
MSARIEKSGIYDMPEAVYHADPCVEPSLSNSIARILLDQSPMHARYAHPRLNLKREPFEVTTAMDFGTALHKLLLGKGASIVEVKADAYRSAAAKEARDAAREGGCVPLLSEAHDRVHECAGVVLEQMKQREDCAEFFAPGRSEAVMIWKKDGIWCRGMVDRLPDDPKAPIFDVKGTGLSANPVEWDRRMVKAYRTQDRFYAQGSKILRGVDPQPMRFVVAEMKAPFAVSVLTPAPTLRSLAEDDVARAQTLWGDCLKRNEWPGYPHTAHIEAPNWLLRQAEEQAMRDDALEYAL